MNDKRIEVNFDGEDEQPAQPPAKRLVITNEDLLNVPDQPRPQVGPVPAQVAPSWQYQKKPGVTAMSSGTVLQGAVAGLVGGFLAWAITEPLLGDDRPALDILLVLIEMGVFGGLIGGIIGCCLGAAEGVVSQVWEKALRAGAIGLGIGAGGGFLGGVFGQLVYGSLLQHSESQNLGTDMVARTIGWSIVGIFVGVGQGVGRGSGKRVTNGLLGGLAGGFIAGFLFDPIASVVQTGMLSRAVGITILGVATGIAVGLVEEIRKEAWLSVIQGPLAGKQFILYELRTRIGSSPKCEITLLKDPGIMPEHAIIEKQGAGHVLTNAHPQAMTLINSQPIQRVRLQSGNVITMGSTSLLFEEKAIGQQGF